MPVSSPGLSPGDEWPHHYRGLSLQVSPDGDVWWQLYQGTDRLHLDPVPEDNVETLLEYKRIGGRMHITETGSAITRVEQDDGDYRQVYLGETTLQGTLTPRDNPEYSIDLRPEGLSSGDLWPGIYDGSRYSFVEDRLWWQNGQTHRRHPVSTDLPPAIMQELRSYKPSGGSFRVTPWGDVITLINMHPAPSEVEAQFEDLPRVVKNIILLRKERDVDMLPIYIGTIEEPALDVRDPTSLTDELSEEEKEELSSWAKSLGRTSETSASSHEASGERTSELSTSQPDTETSQADGSTGATNTGQDTDEEPKPPDFDDDPIDWIEQEVQSGGNDS